MATKLKLNPITGKLDLVDKFDVSAIEQEPEVRQETLDALTDSKNANEGDTLTVDENGNSKWKEGFNPQGNYPNLSVGFAHDITPEEADAISDNTAFVWQTSGGSANIPASATAIIKKICGDSYNNPSTGKIVNFTATHIVSRIYNLFNCENTAQKKVGYKLQSNGNITQNANYTTFWVSVLYGSDNGNNGYVFTPKDQETLASCGLDYVGFQEDEPTQEISSTTIITSGTHGNSTSYLPEDDGWIIFSLLTTKQDCVCLHFAWSGYNDNKFAPYEENILTLPELMSERGLYGIGNIHDELNQTHFIQRIGDVDSSTLSWVKWTERVWNVATQSYIEQFYGYKTASAIENISKSTTNIYSDNVFQLYDWNSDENGLIRVYSDDDDDEILQQLIDGVKIIFELENPVTIEQEFSGLIVVGDFGDIRFFGVPVISAMGATGYMLPSVVEMKYGANYRDTIRALANSGVTFSSQGITTSGVYFGQPITNQNISGSLTWNLEDIQKILQITLTGASTITLPNGGSRPFDFKLKVIQDATGGRALTIAGADSTNVWNINDFDFSAGQANQRCIVALSWDGSEWWFSCSEYFGE